MKVVDTQIPAHRCLAVRWDGFATISVYGPQPKADMYWFAEVLQFALGFAPNYYIVGDLSGKRTYEYALHVETKTATAQLHTHSLHYSSKHYMYFDNQVT